ncbi:MAG: KpsF/GutQ family sugar-phosphate isomerase [Candidatus Binatia bacterium]
MELSLADETDSGLASARRVLRLEAAGIDALAKSLDESFTRALRLLEKVTGRLIVTGMGKSGHVARKIAATFASTGTPASFVHPAEASHGDLGMVTEHDAVIALSNSGETAELADIITYAKRYEIPLIGITAGGASTLAESAVVSLVLPDSPEACPMGLAPTTSTTVMLALGDAIAVALLERKGFSADDFRLLHPGGKLGRMLLRVRTIMHSDDAIPIAPRHMAMSEALLIMTAKSFGCVGIIDDNGQLQGIVTDGDLRRHMSDDLLSLTAGEVMTPRPRTIGPDALASEALGVMNSRSITNLFVVENGRPIGIVHVHDCLRAGVA